MRSLLLCTTLVVALGSTTAQTVSAVTADVVAAASTTGEGAERNQALGVPVNDECVNAIPIDSGTCRVSGTVCSRNDDCTGSDCSFDHADCTADPGVCTNDDLCANKVCATGPNLGADCVDHPDCDGGFCAGTCSLSGEECWSGTPGRQCAGPDTCEPEKCVLRVVGSTAGAVTSGEWFGGGNTVPGVWLTLTGTGNFMSASLCNPGTNYWPAAYRFCRACDGLISANIVLTVGDGSDADSSCGVNAAGANEEFCSQKGAEYRWFLYGRRNPCQRSCSLSGEACGTDDDCLVNVCVGPLCDTGDACEMDGDCPLNLCEGGSCLTGEACSVDGDCPANACNPAACLSGEGCTVDEDCPINDCGVGRCFLTQETCLSDEDCPHTSTGDYEVTVVDSGIPCLPPQPVDCLVGNQVQVVDALLSDDGDDDGWADSNESVEMRVRLRNYGDEELTGLEARVSTDDPKIASITQPMLAIGTLGPKESRVTSAGFGFTVANVERTSVDEEFSVRFDVALSSDRWEAAHRPQRISLDLDLDVAGGTGPSRYQEGFESGDYGTFVPMNLDLFRDTLEASDGFRCRYNDPDNPAANHPGRTSCFLGGTAENAEAFYWQVEGPEVPNGGRSYEGTHALHMGVWVDGEATTPTQVLEAVRSGEPIQLGGGRVCSDHRGVACIEDEDCPSADACVDVAPELSFKHQAAFVGDRKFCDFCEGQLVSSCTQTGSLEPCRTKADCPGDQVCRDGINVGDETAIDRGVVQIQRAAADGSPVGPWVTLEPYEHVYDSLLFHRYDNCSFDPIDDGTTEDDAFEPGESPYGYDDGSRFGPSSTCAGTHVFNYQGDTEFPFDPDRVGRSFDGPGLEGATGLGTWVEPRFSLRRFRGQRVRLRFLNSALELEVSPWPLSIAGGERSHDGWWIDDVRVTDVVASSATLQVDGKACAPGVDGDGDGRVDCLDCAPLDDQAWSPPSAPRPLLMTHSGGTGGTTTLSWTPPAIPGASQIDSYATVVRGPGLCEESDLGDVTSAVDTRTPQPGEVLQFLVRAGNLCGPGTLGLDTAGNPRGGCP